MGSNPYIWLGKTYMFSYVFHGLLGVQGMLAAIPFKVFKDIPGPRYSHGILGANRGTSKARLTAKAEGEAKISPPEGRTKASGGGGEKDVKIVLFFFLKWRD